MKVYLVALLLLATAVTRGTAAESALHRLTTKLIDDICEGNVTCVDAGQECKSSFTPNNDTQEFAIDQIKTCSEELGIEDEILKITGNTWQPEDVQSVIGEFRVSYPDQAKDLMKCILEKIKDFQKLILSAVGDTALKDRVRNRMDRCLDQAASIKHFIKCALTACIRGELPKDLIKTDIIMED